MLYSCELDFVLSVEPRRSR